MFSGSPFLPRSKSSVTSISSVSTSVSVAYAPARAVLLGQHPSKVDVVVKLLRESPVVQIVAAVSDLLDAAVVLKAQVPPVDYFICGAYFDHDAVHEVAAANAHLRVLKVPDGLMMQGGGPQAVVSWIETQIGGIRRGSVASNGSLGSV